MTENNIRQLIFENDSTLFETLDSLDVPQLLRLASDVADNKQSIQQQKNQLDELARKEDNFEAKTTADFISVRSELEDLWKKLDILDDEVAKINFEAYEQEVKLLDQTVEELKTQVLSSNANIEAIQYEQTLMKDSINSIRDFSNLTYRKVETLESSTEQKFAQLQVSVDRLNNITRSGSRITQGTTITIKFLNNNTWMQGVPSTATQYLLAGMVYSIQTESNVAQLRGLFDVTFYYNDRNDNYSPFATPLIAGIMYEVRYKLLSLSSYNYAKVILLT